MRSSSSSSCSFFCTKVKGFVDFFSIVGLFFFVGSFDFWVKVEVGFVGFVVLEVGFVLFEDLEI
ncbi:hypothetical protein Hanom_Chr06g00566851 [Helianthus anomalus]